jgi:hypothetical protein
MQSRRLLVLFGTIPAFILGFCCAGAQTVPLAIAATNVTMPSAAVSTNSGGVTTIPLGSS